LQKPRKNTNFVAYFKINTVMQNLVISVENSFDTQLLMNLVTRLGMKVRTLTAQEERFLTRQTLVSSLSNTNNIENDLSDEDILAVIDEVRTQRYQND
jgi:hypothetical protein